MTKDGEIIWHRASRELPDEDQTLLLATEDGEVVSGFLETGVWRYESAEKIEETVTHWAEFPQHPEEL
jgi:hypothetical protein